MKYYYRKTPINIRLLEDADYKFQLDVSQWVEDNGSITSTTWTVRSGQATVDNTSVTTSSPYIITGYISDTNEGVSRIELKWSDGTGTGVQNILVRFEDEINPYTNDYGLTTV